MRSAILKSGLIFLCFCAVSGVWAQGKAAISPNIVINIAGAPAGKAILVGFFGDQRYRLDSAEISAQGQMIFHREAFYPQGLVVAFLPDNNAIQFFTDSTQQFTMTTRSNDIIGSMQVKGSLENELLYYNLRFENAIQPKFQEVAQALKKDAIDTPEYLRDRKRQDALTAERNGHLDSLYRKYPHSFFTKFKKAGQNPEVQDVRKPDGTVDTGLQVYLFRTHYWDDFDFNDERLMRTPVIINKLHKYMMELTVQVPDSINKSADFLVEKLPPKSEFYKFVVNWVVLNYEHTKTTLMDPEAIYVHMVKRYFTAERAFWAIPDQIDALQQRASEMQFSLVGMRGPNVRAKDPNGQYRAIDDLDAPYVIVFMFNPTCEHCIEQTPKLLKFYNEWKDKGVQIYAIALDTEETEWKNFIKTFGTGDWVNVFDPTNRAIYATYYVDLTPEIYVLNSKRVIIAKNLNVDQIATVLERDMKK